jgi:hypothetical protein
MNKLFALSGVSWYTTDRPSGDQIAQPAVPDEVIRLNVFREKS